MIAIGATAVAMAWTSPATLEAQCTTAPMCSPNAAALGLEPLDELATGRYRGVMGGLYPGGSNEPPPDHLAAGTALAASLTPVRGRIAIVTIGMSNTSAEASQWVRDAAPGNGAVTLVNGAQGGQAADAWVDPRAATWTELDARVAAAGLATDQVRIAWIKQAERSPEGLGPFPAHAEVLADSLAAIVVNLRARYANLALAFVSSRSHAYTTTRPLNPEPYAYESGFAVRWLLERQLEGDPALNYDPARGIVRAPFLAWGPYLWAEGRRLDGFDWPVSSTGDDCTHPSACGRTTIGAALENFFHTSPFAAPWYDGDGLPTVPRPDGGMTTGEDAGFVGSDGGRTASPDGGARRPRDRPPAVAVDGGVPGLDPDGGRGSSTAMATSASMASGCSIAAAGLATNRAPGLIGLGSIALVLAVWSPCRRVGRRGRRLDTTRVMASSRRVPRIAI